MRVCKFIDGWTQCNFCYANFGVIMEYLESRNKLKNEKKKAIELNSTSNQFPCGSPSTKLSDFVQSTWSRNERECKQTFTRHAASVMTSLLMVAPPISISHRLLWCRYSNSRDVVSSSPSFFCPTARVPQRACFHSAVKLILHRYIEESLILW